MKQTLFSRIYGSLAGVAVGDALGFPMHDLPIEEIRRRFNGPVDRMIGPYEDDFIHIGYKAGQVTDDTLLTIQTALAILSKAGCPNYLDVIKWFGDWATANEKVWNSGEVFGPSTKKAFTSFVKFGKEWKLDRGRAPHEMGSSNGAVMRVAPAGLVHPGRIEEAVELAYQVIVPTHGTNIAIAAAGAQAAAIAIALTEEADLISIIDAAVMGAKMGDKIGRERARIVPAADIVARIELAVSLALISSDPFDAGARLQKYIGTNLPAAEALPAAIGIFFAARGDPKLSMVAAVSTGGDTDTIASITGALSGAFRGIEAIPNNWLQTVEDVNHLKLDKLSMLLSELAIEL